MMDSFEPIQWTVVEQSKERLSFSLKGRLDLHSVPHVWNYFIPLLKNIQPKLVEIDASQITYCDDAGCAFFAELHGEQADNQKQFILNGLAASFQKEIDGFIKIQSKAPEPPEKMSALRHFTIGFGRFVSEGLDNFETNVIFIGKLWLQCLYAIFHRRSLRIKDVWAIIQTVGPEALPIIALLGFLMGLISAFQSAIALEKFGAQIYVGSLVGISLVRELGPLMTAIIMAGRTASSFAAEIGTMKIDQELDALTTMGLEPVRFLVLPRIIAATLMAPLLNAFMIFFGIVGCGVVMHILEFRPDIYLQQLKTIIAVHDCIGSLVKASVFGFIIAIAGCLQGFKTRFGSSAVGYATTAAVVSSIIMIIFTDGLFAVCFYVWGF